MHIVDVGHALFSAYGSWLGCSFALTRYFVTRGWFGSLILDGLVEHKTYLVQYYILLSVMVVLMPILVDGRDSCAGRTKCPSWLML